MPVMIQVRNVPDALHQELVRRAAAEGLTLTAYVQRLLEREVARPPRAQVLDRLRALEPVDPGVPPAELIRQERSKAGR